MHITKIELENIKSHAHFEHQFQRGTTAIMGGNGAGKTTLIEAIAWNLFDLLDYKRDDFVRRGAKKGVVNITFESGLDEREYRVYRDTATGYYVYDVQLKTRIAEKKEEVTRFLWQHLGVEPGTDLESLFRRAIGVPQGTFTAIFMETPMERKKAFDRLLKVEEYREGADRLLETSRYIDNRIASSREKIARAEGELVRIETLEEFQKNFTAETKEFSRSLEKLLAEVQKKTTIVQKYDAKEREVTQLKSAFDNLTSELSRAALIESQKENQQKAALAAREKLEETADDYKNHVDAIAKLKEFERERIERDKKNSDLKGIETALANVRAEQKVITANLESALKANQEIKKLEPKAKEEELLEASLQTLRSRIAAAQSAENQVGNLDRKLSELREKFVANKDQINRAEQKSEEAGFLKERQEQHTEMTTNLARFRAKLETDRKFQEEIENGLCPILAAKCLNLEAGQTLDNVVSKLFTETTKQIASLEENLKTLAAALTNSREAEKSLATLKTLKDREKEISDEGKQLKSEKEALEKGIVDLPEAKAELAQTEAKLKALDNPGARVRMLAQQSTNETNIRTERTKIEKNLERLENDRRIVVEQLESYKYLDANWKQYSEKRDHTATAYRTYISNEDMAKSFPEREIELKSAKQATAELNAASAKAENKLDTASKDYDRQRHLSEKAGLLDAERRAAETRANLDNARKRADEIEKELKHLAAVRKAMQREFAEKDRFKQIGEATRFIRETLKNSAPLIAKNYVYHVSSEANQMFRDIMGNAERTLIWAEDYGIFLEEDGHQRPFGNLSGGEQMAAALSVRLALLKQLSDVRLAFFDEPTTNMDMIRRERLAEQISRITEKQVFDQLFVISHDDTFESYADHVITIGNQESEGF